MKQELKFIHSEESYGYNGQCDENTTNAKRPRLEEGTAENNSDDQSHHYDAPIQVLQMMQLLGHQLGHLH